MSALHTTGPRRRSRGFTLMEMMIALLAGGLVVAPLYVVIKGMAETSSALRDGLEARQRARVGLTVLQRDLSRVGLSVSPDPQVDGRSASRDAVGSFAQYRRALVHLNPGLAGNDGLLLSGNFLGSRTYRAIANGTSLQLFSDASQTITQFECTSQFDPAFSFAHVVGGKGRELDARVQASAFAGGTCTVTLNAVDAPQNALDATYGSGDTVWVAANQTVLYRVEPVVDHLGMPARQLVRYYVPYNGSAPPASANCRVTDAALALPGGAVPVAATRQVIADYVNDFQVWLRTVEPTAAVNNGVNAHVPHYTSPSTTTYLGDGFQPADANHIIPASAGDAASYASSVECAVGTARGVHHVRSALVRLAVRTERTDPSVDAAAYAAAGRTAPYRVAVVPGTAPPGRERVGAGYRVETFVVEMPLTNLAGRADLAAVPAP